LIELHPKQSKAFQSNQKISLCAAGIQSGKTTTGALWFRKEIAKWNGKDNAFILGAPTYKILNQSTVPAFLKYMEGCGEYKKADQEYHLRSGGTVYIRTATDPDSVEGIANVRAGWLDEAGKCKYQFWVNFEGRCARTNAPIFCTTTPYARNWPYTELIRPLEQNLRDDVAYFRWASLDNPSFSRESYERQRKLLDPVRFAMKYEGEHARRFGLVFNLPDAQIIESTDIPAQGTSYYGAIDWGFTDPFVVIVRALTPFGTDVQVKEFYQRGVYPDDIPGIVKQIQETYGVKMFLADPSDPGKIAMLQRKGIRVQAADNDIRRGIDAHNKAIRSGKYLLYKACKNSIDEYETYHWPDEEDEGVDAEDLPVDESNHCMDANRYLSLYHEMRGYYDNERPKIIDSESGKTPQLQYTHIPAWKRKNRNSKNYGEI
jgi:PBSX family phage terminase large subunit